MTSSSASSASAFPEAPSSPSVATAATHSITPSPVRRSPGSGPPDARARDVEVLYWSAWKERWAATGPFGGTILPVDEALHFIAHEDIFWVLC